MRSVSSLALPVLALLVLAVGRLPAQADTVGQRPDTAFLAPTVTTVTRATVDLSLAPFALAIATRDEIRRGKPGLGLDEALAGIAGVQVDNRFNYALGERISIRGFGARAQFGVRGVRVLLDGIPMTLADGQTSLSNVDAGTVARAEVMRGPASALHGNAAGGVIQLSTDAASDVTMRQLGGSLASEIGADGLRRNALALAGQGGFVSWRAGASRLRYGGFRDWNAARNDHADFRLSGVGDRTIATLTGNWVRYDAQNPGGLSRALLAADRDQAFANNVGFRTGERGSQGQVGLALMEQLGAVGVQFSTHALQRHVDNPIPQRIVVIDRGAGGARLAISGEPRLGSRGVWMSAGSEVQLQRDDRRNFVNVSGSRGADTLDQAERVTNGAVFAQAGVDLLPRLHLMLGGRYDRVRFRARDRLVNANNPDDSGERSMDAVSPSIGVTWAIAPRLDLYANWATAFETPTTSELANRESGAGGLNPSLDPQRTRSAEIGVNGRVLAAGVSGTYQLSLYAARVRGALIPFELASVPGRQYFRNTGSTRHRGVEAAASLALPRHVTLRLSATRTDARFGDYAVTTGGTTVVYDGNELPGVAPTRGDATLAFQPRAAFIEIETRASSSMAVDDANAERSPGYVIHSLRLGARDLPAGALRISPQAGVLNLFDRDYNTSVVVNAFGSRYYEPGPPRSVYVGATLRY